MSHLPGQPNLSAGSDIASQPLIREASSRPHAAPPNVAGPRVAGPQISGPQIAGRTGPGRVRRTGHSFTNTLNAALIPDRDPWKRLRRRRLGPDPS